MAAISRFLAERRLFITESADFGDAATGLFFMRTVFRPEAGAFEQSAFEHDFAPLAAELSLDWSLAPTRHRPRSAVLVSRMDHCLNDLLYRQRIGALPMEVAGVVSNHLDCQWLAERHAIPFKHIPVEAEAKDEAESALSQTLKDMAAELVVLARYMQVLSPKLAGEWEGRCINIHHSFLPGFKGARPYTRAHDRGVKLIGATAHYVTGDLDEGPIIAQAVEPVSHAHSAEDMIEIGREIEARVLARAVKAHLEGRIFLNGPKTVVFG